MSDGTAAAAVGETGDWEREFAELRREAEELRSAAELLAADLARVVPTPRSDVVRVVEDSDNLIEAIQVDSDAVADFGPDVLLDEINAAIAQARAGRGPHIPDDLIERIARADDLPVATTIFVTNDLGTVTVEVLWRDVINVSASLPWIASTSPQSVADEIARIARLAAISSNELDTEENR